MYTFSEKMVLNVHPSSQESTSGHNNIQVDVTAYSNATIILQQIKQVNGTTTHKNIVAASSFPLLVKDVLLQYKLQRLVIQSASESISSSRPYIYDDITTDDDNRVNTPDIGTPGGISVLARFIVDNDDIHDDNEFDLRFTMLLRSLTTFNLISCGATPFTTSSSLLRPELIDPVSAGRFNPHHLQLLNPRRITSSTVDYNVILPSSNDVGSFICQDNFQAFLALSSPCYSKTTPVGIFSSGPSAQVLHASPRKHLWIDASTTASCFDSSRSGTSSSTSSCSMSLSQGISYTKFIEQRQQHEKNMEGRISFSLQQLLQQREQQPQLLETCPFATSSDIITIIPYSPSPPWFMQHYPNKIQNVTASSRSNLDRNKMQYIRSKHILGALLPNNSNNIGATTATTTTKTLTIDMATTWVSFYDDTLTSNTNNMVERKATTSTDNSRRRSFKHNTWEIHRAHTYIDATGSRRIGIGMFQTCVFNGDDTSPVQVSITDYFPSTILYPLLHTTELWVHQGGGAGDAARTFPQDSYNNYNKMANSTSTKLPIINNNNNSMLDDLQFIISSTSGTTLQLVIELPPDSSLCVSMEYNHRFLPFDFFSADPNRGIDIPPSFATFSPCLKCNTTTTTKTLYTSSLLFLPPSPDMTMPFNVISLTSTFYAFVIGSIMNILIRRSSASINKALGIQEERNGKPLITKMVAKLKEKCKLLHFQRHRQNDDKKVKDE